MQPAYGQPGYPGYVPMPYVPAPKQSDAGLVAVIVVIVLVVISAVLYVLVAGLSPPTQNIPTTVVLQGGGSWVSSGNTSVYTITVSTVQPTNAALDPRDLLYIVSDQTGTTRYSGPPNQNSASSGTTINVVFNDALDSGHVSPGDNIQITVTPGTSNPLRGGMLRVSAHGATVGTVTIA